MEIHLTEEQLALYTGALGIKRLLSYNPPSFLLVPAPA
jgi:hypothetical protein